MCLREISWAQRSQCNELVIETRVNILKHVWSKIRISFTGLSTKERYQKNSIARQLEQICKHGEENVNLCTADCRPWPQVQKRRAVEPLQVGQRSKVLV